MRSVLVVGESLVDVVLHPDGSVREHVGGSAANVAVAVARLGVPVRLATAFGDDEHGRMITDRLRSDGVGLASEPLVVARTSTAVARLAEDGSASYEFDLDWRLGPVEPDEVGGGPSAVHVCSIGALLEPGATAVAEVVRGAGARATISYDINLRPAITGTGPDVVRRVEALASQAAVVKASDEDLEQLYPGRSADDSAAALRALGSRAVVVTRGGAGASAWTGCGRVDVPSPRVTVADTIGAGDTFMAGLLVALADRDLLGAVHAEDLGALEADEWAQVLGFAAAAAARTVGRPGADPPTRAELAG
ncbi:PfkB family carbohydrate kinase [Nocardioides panacisoli]|uniref:Carbohydrate kinase n=1 Tax=Nocardioides panacisoli TaxID=627624 RepID=A0ABP7HZT9_9ACTN